MTFAIHAILERVPYFNNYAERVPYTDCEVELKIADDADLGTIKDGCCTYLDRIINKIVVPLFVTVRSIAGYRTKKNPDIVYEEFLVGNYHFSTNPHVMKAMLKPHRNDISENGLYCHQSIIDCILPVANSIFFTDKSKTPISANDSIMTCDPAATIKYRKFLKHFFSVESVKNHFGDIDSIIRETLEDFELKKGEIILNKEIRLLSTSVMASIFLGIEGPYDEISKATGNIVPWLTENAANKSKLYRAFVYLLPRYKMLSEKDKVKTKLILSQAVKDAIKNAYKVGGRDSIVKAMLNEKFTTEEIESMILTLFLAGTDNVSTSLTHAILKLAQDYPLQYNVAQETCPPLESDLIRAIICESLRVMCPIGGISRIAAKDLSLTLKNSESGAVLSKTRIKKGDWISPMPIFAAKDPSLFPNPSLFDHTRHLKASSSLPNLAHMPFGSPTSPHFCPGWYLYYAISAKMLSQLTKRFVITTDFEGEPKLKAGFVTALDSEIPITLKHPK